MNVVPATVSPTKCMAYVHFILFWEYLYVQLCLEFKRWLHWLMIWTEKKGEKNAIHPCCFFFETEINLFVVLISSRDNMKPDFSSRVILYYAFLRVYVAFVCGCLCVSIVIYLPVRPSVCLPSGLFLSRSPAVDIRIAHQHESPLFVWQEVIGGPKSARSPDEGILLSPPSDARGNDIINSSSDVNLQTRAKGKTHEGKNGKKRIVLGSER